MNLDVPIHELTDDTYLALSGREKDAVDRLLYEQAEGLVHEASSINDLTPSQLADEYAGEDDRPEQERDCWRDDDWS